MDYKSKVVLAVDVEHFGPGGPIKSVGACLCLEPSHEILDSLLINIKTGSWKNVDSKTYWTAERRRLLLRVPPEDRGVFLRQSGFNDSTLEKFWINHPKTLAALDVNCVEYEEACRILAKWCESVKRSYAHALTIVSDNPSTDLAVVNRMLSKAGHLPLNYTTQGEFTFVQDVRMLIQGFQRSESSCINTFLRELNLTRDKNHMHVPSQDAMFASALYGLYLSCSRKQMHKRAVFNKKCDADCEYALVPSSSPSASNKSFSAART